MMSKRLSVITLSAVLGGLVLGLPTPAAHGHGNNPKEDVGETAPPNEPIWPVLPLVLEAGQGFELRPLIVGDVSPKDPGVDAMFGNGSVGIQPDDSFIQADDSFGGSGSLRSMPLSGAIPTPGTLALLGLAALTMKRRRRR
jgi:MYXO-CTERM domain-containing protein